jgi:RimJ/RimL family protein N-acetyltransferase
MKIILKTSRLYLRAFNENDAINLFKLNNNPKVIKYTGNKAFKSVDEAGGFIKNYTDYQNIGYGRWAFCLKSTNEFIGWCGLKLNTQTNEVDLGFRFFENHWGNGYATEAAKACVLYGFSNLKLNEIIGRAYVENKASIAVLEKCAFIFNKFFEYDNCSAVLYTIKNDTN